MWVGGGLFYAVAMLGALAWPYLGRPAPVPTRQLSARTDPASGESWQRAERLASQGSGPGLT